MCEESLGDGGAALTSHLINVGFASSISILWPTSSIAQFVTGDFVHDIEDKTSFKRRPVVPG